MTLKEDRNKIKLEFKVYSNMLEIIFLFPLHYLILLYLEYSPLVSVFIILSILLSEKSTVNNGKLSLNYSSFGQIFTFAFWGRAIYFYFSKMVQE